MRRPLDGIGEHSMRCAWVFLEPHRPCRPLKFSAQNFHSAYMLSCTTSKAVWDTILGKLKMQNLGLAAHNTKQLLYHHPYLRGLIKDYIKHFAITSEQLA